MTLKAHMNKALITFRPQVDGYVTLYCYDGTIGRSLTSFLINKDKLFAVANGISDSLVDSDIDNHIHVYRTNSDTLLFKVYYLRNEKSDGTCEGLIERFTIKVTDLLKVLVCGETVRKVVYKREESRHAKVELSFNAQRAIGKMNRIERRAVAKALRDHFWSSPGQKSEVFLTTDFDGFFFTDDRISGGLIRDARPVYGSDGYVHTGISYSVHT